MLPSPESLALYHMLFDTVRLRGVKCNERQVDQGARLVDKALDDGELFDLDGWKEIESAAKEHTLHLIGLLSDGGVHSRYDQLQLLMKGVRPYYLTTMHPSLRGYPPAQCQPYSI